ncbi:DUF6243 family protein [Streptomyces sp. NPDC101219]|uniref:DUF6243 family protein n=1 Tax=Streptomyces sp. NPDC101219 TaxID=3366131 RepID=UPI0038248083
MTRGGGNMLGVGGTRRNLGRRALRGGANGERVGGGVDPQTQKRELLRKLQEKRQGQGKGQWTATAPATARQQEGRMEQHSGKGQLSGKGREGGR